MAEDDILITLLRDIGGEYRKKISGRLGSEDDIYPLLEKGQESHQLLIKWK